MRLFWLALASTLFGLLILFTYSKKNKARSRLCLDRAEYVKFFYMIYGSRERMDCMDEFTHGWSHSPKCYGGLTTRGFIQLTSTTGSINTCIYPWMGLLHTGCGLMKACN